VAAGSIPYVSRQLESRSLSSSWPVAFWRKDDSAEIPTTWSKTAHSFKNVQQNVLRTIGITRTASGHTGPTRRTARSQDLSSATSCAGATSSRRCRDAQNYLGLAAYGQTCGSSELARRDSNACARFDKLGSAVRAQHFPTRPAHPRRSRLVARVIHALVPRLPEPCTAGCTPGLTCRAVVLLGAISTVWASSRYLARNRNPTACVVWVLSQVSSHAALAG
jgi:hypothetical protein